MGTQEGIVMLLNEDVVEPDDFYIGSFCSLWLDGTELFAKLLAHKPLLGVKWLVNADVN